MEPKWVYRLESKDKTNGLWYDSNGKYVFGIGKIDGCKTKELPMGYDERYHIDGRNWCSSCSNPKDLLHWYSKDDAHKLIAEGFEFNRYLATEYHDFEKETVFIKDTAAAKEHVIFDSLFEEKPEIDYNGIKRIFLSGPMTGYINFNFEKFDNYAKFFRNFGFEVVNPADISRQYKLKELLKYSDTFDEMTRRQMEEEIKCDTLFLFEGWESSRGTRKELNVAIEHGLKIVQEKDLVKITKERMT